MIITLLVAPRTGHNADRRRPAICASRAAAVAGTQTCHARTAQPPPPQRGSYHLIVLGFGQGPAQRSAGDAPLQQQPVPGLVLQRGLQTDGPVPIPSPQPGRLVALAAAREAEADLQHQSAAIWASRRARKVDGMIVAFEAGQCRLTERPWGARSRTGFPAGR
jgi:hypothetical protein